MGDLCPVCLPLHCLPAAAMPGRSVSGRSISIGREAFELRMAEAKAEMARLAVPSTCLPREITKVAELLPVCRLAGTLR